MGYRRRIKPVKRSRKRVSKKPKRNPSVKLRNFTGRIRINPDKTVSVIGTGKRGGKKRK